MVRIFKFKNRTLLHFVTDKRKHANIIFQVLQDPLHFYIVLELLKGGELLGRIRNMTAFTEATAASLMRPLVSRVANLKAQLTSMEQKYNIFLRLQLNSRRA